MNILRKFWQWLCRFASDSWRILQREIAERKQDIASITKVELQQIAKTEGKHFFSRWAVRFHEKAVSLLALQGQREGWLRRLFRGRWNTAPRGIGPMPELLLESSGG